MNCCVACERTSNCRISCNFPSTTDQSNFTSDLAQTLTVLSHNTVQDGWVAGSNGTKDNLLLSLTHPTVRCQKVGLITNHQCMNKCK